MKDMDQRCPQQGSDESRCQICRDPVVGVKVATEDCGVLCVPCAKNLYGFETRTGELRRLGKGGGS
jgi:hypothetical protein